MNDAGLDRRFREDRGDRIWEALQAIDHGDEQIIDAAIFQLVHDAQPEFRALALLDPHAENFFAAVVPNAERDMNRLVADQAFVADFDPQGVVAVLHTWGQNLHHHPQVHCVVPGGGPSPDGTRWIGCRPAFFLPVRVLLRLFRRLFLDALRTAFEDGELAFFGDLTNLAEPATFVRHLRELRCVEWVVYSKPPFGDPAQVLAYLGRYTHRVAIANSRLIAVTDRDVALRWKDYRHHGKAKVMTLGADEFIRRFLLHTLPDGFHRIRHYGFLANGHRAEKLALCRKLLDVPPGAPTAVETIDEPVTPHRRDQCGCCGGAMITLGTLARPEPRRPSVWCDSS